MARTRKWNLRRHLKDLESWLDPKTTDFRRDRPRRELADLLCTHEPDALGFVAIRLEDIALWENQAGAYAVLHGDQSGWSQLRLALHYSAWELRIKYAEYEQFLAKGQKLDVGLAHGLGARSLALAIALREDIDFTHWCGQRMLHDAVNPGGFFHNWSYTPFYSLMARLYARWCGRSIDTDNSSLRDIGIYQGLDDGWTDDKAYSEALLRACDYHSARTVPLDNEYTEFWMSPFDVFPAEILAIQRVREEQLGRPLVVSHPLLDTPLGCVPTLIPFPDDQLLMQVIARVTKARDDENSLR